MRGCLASLGNDGILELFALSAKIFGAELNYCVLRVNPNSATEIWSPRSKIQHPKPSVKFLVTSGGSAGPPNHMFPIISPLGFMGLAHELRLECF